MTTRKSYKETILLPKTAFPMKGNLAELEPRLLARWEKEDLYGRIRREREGREKYVLHDGPPYASGDLHIGTGMNKILKDIVIKYRTMCGRDAPYVPGWDCHGLPIEQRVLTEMRKAKQDWPKAEIRRRSHEFAVKHIEGHRRQFKALGIFGRWADPYLTLDPKYEAGVIDVFGRLVEKGFVYRRRKPIHWCSADQTALAEAELEYKEREDPSVYLRFPLDGDGDGGAGSSARAGAGADAGAGLLVWTTTPWTLFGNVAVAVAKDRDYELVEYVRAGGPPERSWVASALRDRVLEKVGAASARVVETAKGAALEGRRYVRPFGGEGRIVTAPYVSMEDGTGLVHTAPGHGQEDYETALRCGLDVVSPVDEAGKLTAEVPDAFRGQWVLQANGAIVAHLKERGVLLRDEKIRHSYPHCWRCHGPLIFRATEQWFIAVDHDGLRERALGAIGEKVRFVPEWGRTRIEGMVRDRPDWCVSRQRAWGIPIPAFYCESEACREVLLTKASVDRVRDVFRSEGANAWFLKPAGEILGPGFACARCGGTAFRKEEDIFDVWFESGSSWRAVVLEEPELRDRYPCDLYLEGTDQHRGWFQLSLLPAIGATGEPPFRHVVTHGFVVDEKGEKMSKSLGNYISLEDALKKFSGDILRLWFSSVDYFDDIAVSYPLMERMREAYRKIRNTFRFLLGNLQDFPGFKATEGKVRLEPLDCWALAELEQVREDVTRAYEEFRFHRVYRAVHDFCAVEMSALYFEAVRDALYCERADDPRRRGVQRVLAAVLETLVRLLAPILVHTAEEVHDEHAAHVRAAGAGDPSLQPSSIHLAPWPEPRPQEKDDALRARFATLLRAREDFLRAIEPLRKEGKVGEPTDAAIEWWVDPAAAPPELVAALEATGEEGLRELLVVAEARRAAAPPEGAVDGATFPGLKVRAAPSPHPKCERCWIRRPAASPDEPICARCAEVIRE